MFHTFHIPVLGLGYSVDTPLKVARYGISSAISIVDDELIERIREYHTLQIGEAFTPIPASAEHARSKRITAYLDMVDGLVTRQVNEMKHQAFEPGSDICRYFELLPDASQLKQGYELMMEYPDGERKTIFQNILRGYIKAGSIDVNIMAKVDKMNFNADGEYLGDENTDALAALRGFAESELASSVVLSAGMNPRLYSYLETFSQFLPDADGNFQKKIILKVSDFRSALIQAKFLAKKGIWVYEFRVESGLNCGGHAFATDGYLLGPILEEFKQNRESMIAELFGLYQPAIEKKTAAVAVPPKQRISVQGGIGTAAENSFMLDYYELDGTGWGSPFLLVPEVTNVDDVTLNKIAEASEEDYYLSNASPLGILFNNFKPSSSETQRIARIERNRPGSPCTKKYLCSNTEFTEQPICTASRKYQNLKIKQIQSLALPAEEYEEQYDAITQKICLCEGLCSSTYLKYNITRPRENTAVAICPGPNLAYFNRTYSLDEMVKHIYGGIDLLKKVNRPNVFIKELELYVDYLKSDIEQHLKNLTDKKKLHFEKFRAQLQNGINYYRGLFNDLAAQSGISIDELYEQLAVFENKLKAITLA